MIPITPPPPLPMAPVVAVRATGAAMDAPLGEFDATGRRYVPDGAHLAFLAREASRRLAVARTKLDALTAAVEAMGAPPPPPAVTTDDAAEEPRTTIGRTRSVHGASKR